VDLTTTITGFDRQLVANGCSVHTQKAYKRDLRALARWLDDRVDLRRVTPDASTRSLQNNAPQANGGPDTPLFRRR